MQTRESTCELVHFVRHTVYARLTTLALSILIKARQDRGYLRECLCKSGPREFRIMQQRTKGSLKTNKICYLIVSIDQDMTLGLH